MKRLEPRLDMRHPARLDHVGDGPEHVGGKIGHAGSIALLQVHRQEEGMAPRGVWGID